MANVKTNPIIFPKHIFAEVKQCSVIPINLRHLISVWPQLMPKFSRMMVCSRWASTILSAFTLRTWLDYCLHWAKALIWKDLGNCSLKTAMFSYTQTSTFKWIGPWPSTLFPQTLLFFWQLLPFCSNIATPALSAFITTIQSRKASERLQAKVQGSLDRWSY